MKRVLLLAFGFLITSLIFSLEAGSDRTPPDKPAERFTVYVFAHDGAAADGPYSVDKILGEVKKRMKKRGKWLLLAEDREKAEIRIELLGHRVREEHITKLVMRVRSRPASSDGDIPIDYIDTNYLSERHYIEASVQILDMNRMMVGHDGREKGASLKGAASALAQQLEDLLKSNYWDLVQRRGALAQTVPTVSPAPVAPAPAVRSPPLSDAAFDDYLQCVGNYRNGQFVPSAHDITSLTREELKDLGELFLAGERTDAELKAAALLHTESVVTVEQPFPVRPSVARLHAYHLDLAQRYAQAIGDSSDRAHFVKGWHLAVGYRFQNDIQPARAISLLNSGLRLFPHDPELSYSLAALLESQGTLKQDEEALRSAERIYRALAATEPAPPDLEVHLAHVLIHFEQLNEAEELLSEALSGGGLGDVALAAWMLKGEIAEKRNYWAEARNAYRAAWELSPGCQACTVALALAYEHTGEAEDAHRLIKQWLETPAASEPDGWWRYLFGGLPGHREILSELRTEVHR